jgi:hypothetical protein
MDSRRVLTSIGRDDRWPLGDDRPTCTISRATYGARRGDGDLRHPRQHAARVSDSFEATIVGVMWSSTYPMAAVPDAHKPGNSAHDDQTQLMIRHNSDAILGPGVHFKATVALYPIYWLYNHVPGADFADLVDAPIRVGDADDYDGGGDACKQLLSELALRDAEHVSLRVLPGATHILDSFTEAYEFPDPDANRQKGGIVHVRPDSEACEQARDDMTRFFIAAFKPQ